MVDTFRSTSTARVVSPSQKLYWNPKYGGPVVKVLFDGAMSSPIFLQFQMMTDNISRPVQLAGPILGVVSDVKIWRDNKPHLRCGEKALADLEYIGEDDLV